MDPGGAGVRGALPAGHLHLPPPLHPAGGGHRRQPRGGPGQVGAPVPPAPCFQVCPDAGPAPPARPAGRGGGPRRGAARQVRRDQGGGDALCRESTSPRLLSVPMRGYRDCRLVGGAQHFDFSPQVQFCWHEGEGVRYSEAGRAATRGGPAQGGSNLPSRIRTVI